MSFSSLTYVSPIRGRLTSTTLDYDLLDAAAGLFDSGAFLESVEKVFAHVLPARLSLDLGKGVHFNQGSSRVFAKVEGETFSCEVPLVRISAGGASVAALRYALTSINCSGQLYQARLRGDDIYLEFAEKLSALHPQKLLEVLRRMPVEADRHDDWMINQFQALPLDRAEIVPLTDSELASARQFWDLHWNDVEELLKEAQRRRTAFFLNEVAAFAIYRLRYTLPLGGSLLPRFLASAEVFNDAELEPMRRETALAKCIKEMRERSGDELTKSLGHSEYTISPRADGTPARMTSFFGPGNYMDSIDKARSGSQAMVAALALTSTYYYLLVAHNWPAAIEDALESALRAASGKSWREVANGLFAHTKILLEQVGSDEDGEDEEDDKEADAGAEDGQ